LRECPVRADRNAGTCHCNAHRNRRQGDSNGSDSHEFLHNVSSLCFPSVGTWLPPFGASHQKATGVVAFRSSFCRYTTSGGAPVKPQGETRQPNAPPLAL
jgi:hypothetical protein